MTYVGPFTLIEPIGVVQNSSDVFNILDPDSGGAATFRIRLSASGAEPATHVAARTMLEAATYDALVNMTVQQFKAYVDQVATQRGRTPVGSITAFKNNLVIGSANFAEALAAAGLKRIETPTV
jgi:hypothetical protein